MSEELFCAKDLSIFDLIFDQTQCKIEVDDFTRPVNDESDAKDNDEGNSDAILSSKRFELEGVKLAEAGIFDEALKKFNESIALAGQRPSPYNNRAQLYRLMKKDNLALIDLTKSIELSEQSFNLTKCRAFCQRGIIKRKLNDINGARIDFNEGVKLGSKFARQQLIELNPYAQLCNQMVTKLFTDIK